jgi:thiamine biosynthesis lipoprotein
MQTIITLQDRSLATSGNYRKFYIKDGKKYSHTINPVLGKPVEHNLLSATVVAGNAMDADAYATILMVLGVDKAKRFLDEHKEIDAYLVFSVQDRMEVYSTKGFDKLIAE